WAFQCSRSGNRTFTAFISFENESRSPALTGPSMRSMLSSPHDPNHEGAQFLRGWEMSRKSFTFQRVRERDPGWRLRKEFGRSRAAGGGPRRRLVARHGRLVLPTSRTRRFVAAIWRYPFMKSLARVAMGAVLLVLTVSAARADDSPPWTYVE